MKHTRTKRLGGLPIQQVTITATVEWSDGIPHTRTEQGEPAGWTENTEVEITFGRFTLSMSFQDTESNGQSITEPAQWIVDEVATSYRLGDGRKQTLAWGEKPKRKGGHLRLSALPEVLEVVQDAYEDHMALERLQRAQESVHLLESQADAIRSEGAVYGYRQSLSVKEAADIRQLEAAADEARRDLAEAERVATERGVR